MKYAFRQMKPEHALLHNTVTPYYFILLFLNDSEYKSLDRLCAEIRVILIASINTAQANGIDVKEYLTNIFRTGERRLPLKSE